MIPKPIREHPRLALWILPPLSVIVVAATVLVFLLLGWIPRWVVRTCAIGMGLLAWLWIMAVRSSYRKTRDQLSRYGNRVCTRCEYVLSALPPEGECPECGKHYDIDEVMKYWNRIQELWIGRA